MTRLYAWCFSHGLLHKSDWCEATWVKLHADSEEDALRLKNVLFGEARFVHELPVDMQYIVTMYDLKEAKR